MIRCAWKQSLGGEGAADSKSHRMHPVSKHAIQSVLFSPPQFLLLQPTTYHNYTHHAHHQRRQHGFRPRCEFVGCRLSLRPVPPCSFCRPLSLRDAMHHAPPATCLGALTHGRTRYNATPTLQRSTRTTGLLVCLVLKRVILFCSVAHSLWNPLPRPTSTPLPCMGVPSPAATFPATSWRTRRWSQGWRSDSSRMSSSW